LKSLNCSSNTDDSQLVQMAQAHAKTEKRSRIIVVIYGDIGKVENQAPDMKDLLKLYPTIKWGEKSFRKKLYYALPHVKLEQVGKNSWENVKMSSLIKSEEKNPSATLATPPVRKIDDPMTATVDTRNQNIIYTWPSLPDVTN
jgi:hypothetical protein